MKRSIFSLLCLLLVLASCNKSNTDSPQGAWYYANAFAYNVMQSYYLWNKDIADDLKHWSTSTNPVEKVKTVRVAQDRWTTLYEDYTRFEGTTTGTQKSFGLDITASWADESQTRVAGIVNYTYADSPAQKAGLQRGDIILTVDGSELTKDNYQQELGKLYSASQVRLGLQSGRDVDLAAVSMYMNPVQTVKTLQYEGRKIGYLNFTSFTLDACKDLETAFAGFKADGIDELILDLRYNGGGYAMTALVLASMIAPLDVVEQGAVYNKDVYNDILSSEMAQDTCFEPSYSLDSKTIIHAAQVNPGLKRLWVLVSGTTASASEALICGLKAHMDVYLVGTNTYGKYCGGILIKAPDWFKAVKDSAPAGLDCQEAIRLLPLWGMYVIISRYADCNGVTLSMPSGIPADVDAPDMPWLPVELGDPSESMLSAALQAIVGSAAAAAVKSPAPAVLPLHRPGFGVLLH